MRAAFLVKAQNIQLQTIATPVPQAGEVRIKLQQIGICGSDVHLFLGHRRLSQPTVIGHEGLGIIDQVGTGVSPNLIGKRVVVEPNFPCGKCRYCQRGQGNICVNKRVLGVTEHGCFAEYVCVPVAFAWVVPDSLSDAQAVVIEPMAVAYHALFAAKAQPGEAIAVVGLGAIGLLLTHLATRLGYQVFVSEPNTAKRAKAVAMGAIALDASGGLQEQVAQLAPIWLANEVSAVFECAGSAFTASLVTAATPRGASIVLVGLSEKDATFCPLKIAREGITLVPSIIYDHPDDFKRTIRLIASGIIDPSIIISSYTSLDKLQEALQTAAQGEESKIVVKISSSSED